MNQQIIDDGEHAKRLLEDPLLQRVLTNLVEDLQLRWTNTNPEDHQLREQLFMELQGVKKFSEKIKAIHDNGLLMAKTGR